MASLFFFFLLAFLLKMLYIPNFVCIKTFGVWPFGWRGGLVQPMVNLLWQSPQPLSSPTPPLHFMVHRSIVCPINDFVVYTHILHITWRLNYVDATVHQRQFDIVMKSCACWVPTVHVFIFTRHRWRGTIEMTLICLCVHPSILHSIPLSVRPIFIHNYNSSYIFHRTDLKFYRLPSYHMKMCKWFLIFVSAIFYQVMALTDFVPATPATSFVELA